MTISALSLNLYVVSLDLSLEESRIWAKLEVVVVG